MYPNPTTGKVYINFSVPLTNASVLINDMSGRTIKKFNSSGKQMEIDLSTSPSGMYVITINDGTNVWNNKIIKQ